MFRFEPKQRITERLKISRQELDEVSSRDNIFDELCRDYEEVVEALRRSEDRSQAAGETQTPDLELVRLARELEDDIFARFSLHTKQPGQR
jgi:DNA-directed RNA polymerase subunit H (RpoH/RPB5)